MDLWAALDERRDREIDRRLADVERLCLDPLWIGAGDSEIAASAGVSIAVVRRTRDRLARDAFCTEVLQAALELAEAIGHSGDPIDLIAPTLREAAKRWGGRR